MMKVLLTKPFFPSDIKYIQARIDTNVELVYPKEYTHEAIIAAAENVDVLFGGMITDELLSAAKNLKFIQVPWTGVDKMDFALLQKHNSIICNSHSNSTVVAEHAISLLFDAAKKLSFHDRGMREGVWNRPGPNNIEKITPFSKLISNANVGIVGFGAIGKDIYKMLSGFNCQFKVFNRSGNTLETKNNNISFYSSEEIESQLSDLDFVFVAIALTSKTNQMVNASFLEAMNKEGILINVSRGEVIDEAALFNALSTEIIAFAGIDTWFKYPSKDDPTPFPSEKCPFHTLNNLVMSPHRAGMVQGGFPHLDDAIENINRSNIGKELINKVSLTEKY